MNGGCRGKYSMSSQQALRWIRWWGGHFDIVCYIRLVCGEEIEEMRWNAAGVCKNLESGPFTSNGFKGFKDLRKYAIPTPRPHAELRKLT